MPLTHSTIPAENGNLPLPQAKPPSAAGGDSLTGDVQMNEQNGSPASVTSAQKYLIRIPQKTDRVKAITAFRRIRATRVTLPDNVMGVNEEHIRVLETENIPFQYVSKAPNGKSTAI